VRPLLRRWLRPLGCELVALLLLRCEGRRSGHLLLKEELLLRLLGRQVSLLVLLSCEGRLLL